ncbi:hypothetical protein Tco_0764850 [Tanacetum coccineum]
MLSTAAVNVSGSSPSATVAMTLPSPRSSPCCRKPIPEYNPPKVRSFRKIRGGDFASVDNELIELDDDMAKQPTELNAGNDGNSTMDATKAGDDSESDVEDVFDETAQFMTSSSKWASGSGGANEASFCENEDYDIYDGHED